MRRYQQASGAFFGLLAILQLTRLLLQWPVTVAGFEVPLWPSAVASVILFSFAIWGFRAAGGHSETASGA